MAANDLVVWPGSGYPLGADYRSNGTNFALYAGQPQAVDLRLVDEAAPRSGSA